MGYAEDMLKLRYLSGEDEQTGEQGLNRGIGDISSALANEVRKKQQMNDAIQMLLIKAQIERTSDPLKNAQAEFLSRMLSGQGFTPRNKVIDTTGEVLPQEETTSPYPESMNIGGFGFKFPEPENIRSKRLKEKIEEQGAVAEEKAQRLSQEKLKRFIPLRNIIEQKWLETKPYKSSDIGVKFGAMPFLGAWDASKKWLQVTKAQRKDKAYTDFVGALRARIARSLGEDVGNLSEYEQAVILSAVPTLMDVYETGKDKLKNLDDLIVEIQKAREKGKTLEEYREMSSSDSLDNDYSKYLEAIGAK